MTGMMRVSVFGLGYVGSVTAASLAREGHEVVGVDVSPDKVAMMNRGDPPVVEPGLGELLGEVTRAGRLRATRDAEEAIRSTDVALISVGTPGRRNGQLDVSTVERVGYQIGRALRRRSSPFTVVLRSTVLPGTTESVLVPAIRSGAEGKPGSWLVVAVNPEFMREGSALRDFAHPPLTLVGCEDPAAEQVFRQLYAGVEAPFLCTAVKTAEMVKYVSNGFHALKVCFANEIADLSAALGADGREVMRIFAMDRKLNISEAYLRPGFAFGGSCLPKDLRALLYAARSADVALPLLSGVFPSNERQVRRAANAVLETRRRRVGVVGLSFKPGTDDLRESPMVELVEILIGKGCDLRILDRNVSIARLVGANRRYIEEGIPHISALMCEEVTRLLEHAEVIVIGNASDEAEEVLAGVGPQHTIIDLTRGEIRPAVRAEQQAVLARSR